MKNLIISIALLLVTCWTTEAQTFEKDNFIFRINEDGTASWCGLKTVGSKHHGFFWEAWERPVISVKGRPDDIKYAYKKSRKDIRIPESVKYEGKKYLVASIDVDDNYFFRPLDEQKKDGPMPWLCQLSIYIPASVKEIPERMWALHYEGLRIVFKEPQNRYVEDGHCMLDKTNQRIVAIDFYSMPRHSQVAREVILPKSAKSLSPFAMRGHILYSVRWPETITEIEPETFRNCIFLSDVIIPSHIRSIGMSAFQDASGLGEVRIEDGVESIGAWAFYHSIVTKVTMPQSCRTLGCEVFGDCHSLRQVVLPETLAEIPERTFQRTYALEGVNIPSSVQHIANSAFQESRIGSIVLPANLKKISPNTFTDCKALTKVVLPQHLESIGSKSFMGCFNLFSLDVPASCESIEDAAFSGSSIQCLKVANPQLRLAPNALEGMSALKFFAMDGQTSPELAMPLIESVLTGHSAVLVHLNQSLKPFQDRLSDETSKNRLHNGSWQFKNVSKAYDFVPKLQAEAVNKKVADDFVQKIQSASILFWCQKGDFESYHNYGDITVDPQGRILVTAKGYEASIGYLEKAVEHQLCGISGFLLETGGYSYQPQISFAGSLSRIYTHFK